MDSTHITLFPIKHFLHVVINTYSCFLWAVLLTYENAKITCYFLLECFSVMNISHTIKLMMNQPTLIKLFKYSVLYGNSNMYSYTLQSIIERAHRIFKIQFLNNKMGVCRYLTSYL